MMRPRSRRWRLRADGYPDDPRRHIVVLRGRARCGGRCDHGRRGASEVRAARGRRGADARDPDRASGSRPGSEQTTSSPSSRNLGLGMLFFFAGYEIDFQRIRGRPLTLGAWGWAALRCARLRDRRSARRGRLVISFLYTGSALATTAIGTLIPIMRDTGELRSRFGTYCWPPARWASSGRSCSSRSSSRRRTRCTKRWSCSRSWALAIGVALASIRLARPGWTLLERTLESSSQLAVRIVVVLVFGLLALTEEVGLDILLGGLHSRDDHPHRPQGE